MYVPILSANKGIGSHFFNPRMKEARIRSFYYTLESLYTKLHWFQVFHQYCNSLYCQEICSDNLWSRKLKYSYVHHAEIVNHIMGINLPLFSTIVPSIICMLLSCRPFVVITLSTGLVGVEVTSVSWLGQLTEVTSTPTRPVDNVITTKGLQDRNIHIIDGTVENKGKLILTEIFPSVEKT